METLPFTFIISNTSDKIQTAKLFGEITETIKAANWGNPAGIEIVMGTPNVTYLQFLRQCEGKPLLPINIKEIGVYPSNEMNKYLLEQQQEIPALVITKSSDGTLTCPYYYQTKDGEKKWTNLFGIGIPGRSDEMQFTMLPKTQLIVKIFPN